MSFDTSKNMIINNRPFIILPRGQNPLSYEYRHNILDLVGNKAYKFHLEPRRRFLGPWTAT